MVSAFKDVAKAIGDDVVRNEVKIRFLGNRLPDQ
jgi:hypothetical protein